MGSDKTTYSDVLKSKESIAEKMAFVGLRVGGLEDPMGTFIECYTVTSGPDNEAIGKQAQKWMTNEIFRAIEAAAQATGASKEEIISGERTEEQAAAVERELMNLRESRLETLKQSNWGVLSSTLQSTGFAFYDHSDGEAYQQADAILKREIMRYYFAVRPDIDPIERSSIAQEHFDALADTIKDFIAFFDAFIAEFHPDPNESWNISEAIHEFYKAQQGGSGNKARRKKDKEIGDPPFIVGAARLKKFIVPNNKAATLLFTGAVKPIDKDEKEDIFTHYRVSDGKGKKNIVSSISISYEGDDWEIVGKRAINLYDRPVYNAVCSLWEEGARAITPAMIYKAMTYSGSGKSPRQLRNVENSFEKMVFTLVRIKCKEELGERRATLYGMPPSTEVEDVITRYLINADILTRTVGGHRTKVYVLNQKPVLYDYSSAVKQVVSYDPKLLEVTDENGIPIANTDSRIAIRSELLRRIKGMQGYIEKKNHLESKTISFTGWDKGREHHPGLYEMTLGEHPTKKQTSESRKYIQQCLEYWKRENEIKGYQFIKKGRTITGVEIQI